MAIHLVIYILYRHIFGAESRYSNTLLPVDEHNVVYIAGHGLVIHNLEARTQRFISGSPESECITAIAIAPSGKHLAVAEKSEKGVVTVYDLLTLKRRKVLALSETACKVNCFHSSRCMVPLRALSVFSKRDLDSGISRPHGYCQLVFVLPLLTNLQQKWCQSLLKIVKFEILFIPLWMIQFRDLARMQLNCTGWKIPWPLRLNLARLDSWYYL